MVVHHVDVQPVGAVHRGDLVCRARAKSAARIDGAISGLRDMARSPYFEGGREHRVGAVPVRPQLHVRPVTEVVDRIEQRPGVQRRHRMAAQRVGDHPDGLGQVRRAGRVQHHTAGPGQPDRRGQQLALQLGQLRHVAGLTAPARLGPAPQRAQPGARRVDQHPVEARLEPGVAAVDAQHVDRQAAGVLLDEVGAPRGRARSR